MKCFLPPRQKPNEPACSLQSLHERKSVLQTWDFHFFSWSVFLTLTSSCPSDHKSSFKKSYIFIFLFPQISVIFVVDCKWLTGFVLFIRRTIVVSLILPLYLFSLIIYFFLPVYYFTVNTYTLTFQSWMLMTSNSFFVFLTYPYVIGENIVRRSQPWGW